MDPLVVPRLAGAEDAEALARLLLEVNAHLDAPSPPPPVLTGRLRELLDGVHALAIVAGEPGVAVALVSLRPSVWFAGPIAVIDELFVLPAWRGRGIGGAVLELAVRTCRHRSAELIELNVDAGDVDVQRFYERHGFSGRDGVTDQRAWYFAREL